MNCNQIFIDQLRCPDLYTKNQHASLNCPPKYSQSFIMNQIIHKPRILRNQYSVQKYSSSTEDLCQSFEQPQVLNLTISQLRDLKSINKTKKTSLCTKSKSKEKNLQVPDQYHERKRSNTYHVNSLAKTALLFVNRQDKRMKISENVDNHFDIKNLELLQSNQQSVKNTHFNTTIMLPNYNFESTLHSCVSQTNISLANQINLVITQFIYFLPIKNMCLKLINTTLNGQNQKKQQKIYPKSYQKNMLQFNNQIICYTSDDTSLYLESSRFKIERNFNQIYKAGKFRWLYPGEEAAIIESIESFLNDCSKKIQSFIQKNNIQFYLKNFRTLFVSLLMMSAQKILKTIIIQKRLEYLFNYPICMKQIEAHWKIMATIFKLKQQHRHYKNQVTNKLWKDIQASKTLFLDLNLDNNKLTHFVKQLQI